MRIRPSLWVALFFVALTLIGIWTAADYGLPCDEPSEQVILRENLMEYALRLQGPESAAVQAYRAAGVQPISESIERDHGQSAYYAAAPLLKLEQRDPARMTTLWHQYTWLWFMVGAYALYAIARSLGMRRWVACAAALFLVLAPRFFAEGHYNNKDVVLLALVLWTFASAMRLVRKPGIANALWFGLAGAMATNTKIVGFFAWGLAGLAVFATLGGRRALTPRIWRAALCALGGFALFYALLTPALWADPLGYFPYVLANASGFTRWTGVVLYRGALYDPAHGLPLPHSYLPVMIALTLPLGTLLFAVAGQVRALRLCLRRDARWPFLCAFTLLWLVPVAYVVARQPLLYNGWRHFYFVFAGIAVLAALGLEGIWLAFARTRIRKVIAAAALAAMFAVQAVGIATQHPYQYAYYNILAGDVQTRFELDYWDVSTVNAMRKLCALAAEGGTAEPLLLGSRDTMSDFGVQHGYAVLTAAERDRLQITAAPDAPYLFYNATYAQLYGVDAPEGYHVLFTLQGYGSALCTVYEQDRQN